MQYCCLQHWTLLLSPVTSTTGCCFCFGSVPSFFLELFLHRSPVAYWAPTDLGSSSFSVLSFAFHTLPGVLKAVILKWFAIPFSSGPHSVRPLHHDPSVLDGPRWHGLVLELDKLWPVWPDWPVVCECGSVCLPSDALSQRLPSYCVSLILDMGYVFMAAPAKRSHCSLLWT